MNPNPTPNFDGPGVWAIPDVNLRVESQAGEIVIPAGTVVRLLSDADESDLRPTFENRRLPECRQKIRDAGLTPCLILHEGRLFATAKERLVTSDGMDALANVKLPGDPS